ncbi:MAG: PLD nuclease N-terminal domain-containing protein [Parafilimonas sp.]
MGNLALYELILIVIVLVLPLIALVDILKSNFKKDVNKTVWVIVVIFLPVMGSILYFLQGRGQKAGN